MSEFKTLKSKTNEENNEPATLVNNSENTKENMQVLEEKVLSGKENEIVTKQALDVIRHINNLIKVIETLRGRGAFDFNQCVEIGKSINVIKTQKSQEDIQKAVDFLFTMLNVACKNGKLLFEECVTIDNEISSREK